VIILGETEPLVMIGISYRAATRGRLFGISVMVCRCLDFDHYCLADLNGLKELVKRRSLLSHSLNSCQSGMEHTAQNLNGIFLAFEEVFIVALVDRQKFTAPSAASAAASATGVAPAVAAAAAAAPTTASTATATARSAAAAVTVASVVSPRLFVAGFLNCCAWNSCPRLFVAGFLNFCAWNSCRWVCLVFLVVRSWGLGFSVTAVFS
jgi:hypothetical protein